MSQIVFQKPNTKLYNDTITTLPLPHLIPPVADFNLCGLKMPTSQVNKYPMSLFSPCLSNVYGVSEGSDQRKQRKTTVSASPDLGAVFSDARAI